MSKSIVFSNISLNALQGLAKQISKNILLPRCLMLSGDLGAGKTTFARFLIRSLTAQDIEVLSPTFNLIQTYETKVGPLWHCDLYRLKSPEEASSLGLEDAFHQAICIIEWPEILDYLIPKQRLDIEFELLSDSVYQVTLTPYGPAYENLITNLKAA